MKAPGTGSCGNSNLTLLGLLFQLLANSFTVLGDTWEFIPQETGASGSVCKNRMRPIFLCQFSSFKAVIQACGRQPPEPAQPQRNTCLGFGGQRLLLCLQIDFAEGMVCPPMPWTPRKLLPCEAAIEQPLDQNNFLIYRLTKCLIYQTILGPSKDNMEAKPRRETKALRGARSLLLHFIVSGGR